MEEDKLIIEQIIKGDTNQFKRLIEKYQNLVFRVVLKIVGNNEDAREINQDIFVKIYESLHQYDPKYKFFSWLYRIAINSALQHVKQRKYSSSFDESPFNETTLTDNVIDNVIDIEMRRRLLNKSINELSEKYKSVIALKYYANFSYTDIAETLEIDERKVKSRLFDGRKLLKEKLEKTDFFSNIQYN